jgi:hypothetical protein
MMPARNVSPRARLPALEKRGGPARLPIVLALVFGAAGHAAAWPLPPQPIASRLILASVTDADGRPLVDIELDDFVVRDAAQLRDVLSSRVADYPIAIVLDNSRGDPDLEAIRRATLRFIDRVGHRPIAIASTSPPRMMASFDDDRATAIRKVDTLRKGPGMGLFEAIATAAGAIQETGASFSAIVVVVANPGTVVPAERLTPILESGANVHLVIQQKASDRASELRRQSTASLGALVDDTRGWLTTIFSPDSYRPALDRLANQLATELIVEYVVPAGSSSGGDVQFGVRVAGATIRNWAPSRRH